MNKFYSAFFFTLLSFAAFSQALYNDGSITIEGTGLVYVNGDVEITDNGTLTPDGTLEVKGNFQQDGNMTFGASGERLVQFTAGTPGTAQVISSNNGSVTFHSVDFANPAVITGAIYTAGGVEATTDIIVNGEFDVQGGDVIMNNYDITFGSDAILSNYSATEVCYFTTGTLNRRIAASKLYEFPIYQEGIGYVPVEVDIDAAAAGTDVIEGRFVPQANLGSIFHAGHCQNLFGGGIRQHVMLNKLIDGFGYWQLDPFNASSTYTGNNAGWDYDITVHYPQATLDNFATTFGSDYFKVLKVPTYDGSNNPITFNPATTDWDNAPNVSGAYCSGIVELAAYNEAVGITAVDLRSFSGFGGAGNAGGGGLPVELVSLEANAVDNEFIRLDWITATETDNMGFEVLRSTDGITFDQIGWIDGANNTTVTQYYTMNDNDVVPGVVYYYRLNQIDYDGDNEMTYIVSATLTSENVLTIGEFIPNPTFGGAILDITTSEIKDAEVTVFNTLGQIITAEELTLTAGSNRVTLDAQTWAAGTYYTVIVIDNQVYNKKLVVSQR